MTEAPSRPAGARPEALTIEAFRHEWLTIEKWGTDLACRLADGRRMLAVGDGGGADNAEQLVVGLGFRLAAVAPPPGPMALRVGHETAPAGQDGDSGALARRVGGLVGRGDVLVAFSPSGAGADVLGASRAARSRGALVWSFTGPLPNPLASGSTEVVTVAAGTPAAIRQRHQLALQLLCEVFEDALASRCRLEPTMAANRLRWPSAAHEHGPW